MWNISRKIIPAVEVIRFNIIINSCCYIIYSLHKRNTCGIPWLSLNPSQSKIKLKWVFQMYNAWKSRPIITVKVDNKWQEKETRQCSIFIHSLWSTTVPTFAKQWQTTAIQHRVTSTFATEGSSKCKQSLKSQFDFSCKR